MDYFVKAVGILVLTLAVVIFARPATIRSFIDFAKVGKRVYIGGVIRVTLGALLLLASPRVIMPWIPALIGALMLVSGILIFSLGVQRIHAVMDWMRLRPDNTIRAFVLIPAIFGIALIYSA